MFSLTDIGSSKKRLLLSALPLLLAACATITGSGTTQSISVQTYAPDGQDLADVTCELSNDEGLWFVTTPGSTVIRRSNKPLHVICKKPGIPIGTATVESRTTGHLFGNIFMGGGLGAIVDHNNGSAYAYPPLLKIYMGQTNQKIEK